MKRLTLFFKLLPAFIGVLLVGCSFEESDDLDQFVRNAGNDMQVKVKPLPEVKTYLSFDYNVDGILSDPFKSRKIASKSGRLQPNINRPREPLEFYPLESLKYVGLLQKSKLTYALLKTPDSGIQQIKTGNYVGQNFGMVTEIKDNEIVLKEIFQDEASGDWMERVATIALLEQ